MTLANQPKLKLAAESVASASDLPEWWVETMLDQLLQGLESGSRPKGGVRGITEGIPSIGGEHLNENGGFRFEFIKFVPYSFFERMNQGHIQTGDILIVKDGATTGKVALVRDDFPYNPAVVNEHVFICRPDEGVYPAFLFYFLFSNEGQDRILENFRGSAQGGINKSFAPGTDVPLAPLAEQKRIVAKVEELLARVNAARDRLAKVSEILRCFRQSVLAAACSGRLTADWRDKYPDMEPSLLLLERIHEQRKKIKAKVKTKINLPPMDCSGLPQLPVKWEWTRVGEISDKIHYGYTASSKNEPIGPKLLRITDIQNNSVNWKTVPYCKIGENEKIKYLLKEGDLVFARTGATVGKSYLLSGEFPEAVFASYLIRIVINERVSKKYIYSFFQTLSYWEQITSGQVGIGQPNVNAQILSEIILPLPPPHEQQEIVHRVDALFKLANAIEKRVAAAITRAEKLTQAILAKAFRGELVLTEAELARHEGRSYEPASALLAKIKAQRKDVKPQRKGQNAEKGLLDKNNIEV